VHQLDFTAPGALERFARRDPERVHVSPASCEPSAFGRHGQKKRVSKRRARPGAVIQWPK